MSALEYRMLGVVLIVLGVLLLVISQLILHAVRKRMKERVGRSSERGREDLQD